MTHTPGPWVHAYVQSPYDSKENPETDDCYVVDKRGFHVAKVYSPENQFVQHGEEANANLIAAAPEMLEALELVLNDNRLMNAMNKEQARAILDAIRKARGEA